MNEEIEKHIPLAKSIAKSFYKKNPVYSLQDLEQVGCMTIVKVMKKYNSEKSKISTFLTKCIRNDIIKFMKSQKLGRDISKAAKRVDVEYELNDLDCIKNFNSTEEEVLRMKLSGFTMKDISKKLKISLKKTRQIMREIREVYEE
jgi:RNA polymerase sigma factor (sigma-70 family)